MPYSRLMSPLSKNLRARFKLVRLYYLLRGGCAEGVYCGQIPQIAGMSVVEVDERFRVTLPKEVRKSLPPLKGRKVYVVGGLDTVVLKVLPEDPCETLRKILGDFAFDRRAREAAEEWLLERARST